MRETTLYGQVIKPCEKLSWRDVNGELVVINVDSGEYHIFNGAGRLIWQALVRGESAEEIIQQILDLYSVEREKTASDLNNFIDNLMHRKLLKKPASLKKGGLPCETFDRVYK